MSKNNQMEILKDKPNRKITIIRNFDATQEQVWSAWTTSELLDQWWAPKPWKAETKTMDFKVGGHWLYAMVGPDNMRHWARVDFTAINAGNSFSGIDSFCDELGNLNTDFPRMNWRNTFETTATGTQVTVVILFNNETDLEKLVAMGFEAGFTAALTNLDYYLNTQFRIRKELKNNNMARVSTYLNFPGNTEEAFNFYKKVFNGEFTGGGLIRFGDMEMPAEMPPMQEADKKLIIHAELTILGGHVLMATDSPESFGMKMEYGNNMHINLEPENRAETLRLFNELSDGGKIIMPLTDMFWGAYFGTFTDKFGINWMLNFQTPR